MRGNYQKVESLMKFTPDTAGMSNVYQIQQYTRTSAPANTPDTERDVALFSAVVPQQHGYGVLSK